MGSDLRELVKQERNILKSFDAVQIFIDRFNPESHSRQVAVRIQRLEDAFKEFHNVRRQIEIIMDNFDDNGGDAKDTTQEREARRLQEASQREEESEALVMEVEDKYCALKADLLTLLPKSSTVNDSQSPSHSHHQRQDVGLSRVKLPEIKLPTFSGQLNEWVTFRDTFCSLIHNNQQLTGMDKFTYLRSSLSGEAIQEINSVEMSNANTKTKN